MLVADTDVIFLIVKIKGLSVAAENLMNVEEYSCCLLLNRSSSYGGF